MSDVEVVRDEAAPRDARLAAVKALATSSAPVALDALCGVLDTRDEALRSAARSSLARLGGAQALAARAHDPDVPEASRVLALTGLRYFRDDVEVSTLAALLKAPSAAVRAQAALALAVIGPARAEAALLAALGDSDPKVRFFAADGLAMASSVEAKRALAQRLEVEADASVRYALIAARNRQAG